MINTTNLIARKIQQLQPNSFESNKETPSQPQRSNVNSGLLNSYLNNLAMINIPAVKKSENKVLIEVGDNGKGIPENLRDKIFRPYVTENSARTGGGGTGLGLSIAKKITELHGGNITLHEKPPKGIKTLFTIELNQKEKG